MIHPIATRQTWRIHPQPQAGASSAFFREDRGVIACSIVQVSGGLVEATSPGSVRVTLSEPAVLRMAERACAHPGEVADQEAGGVLFGVGMAEMGHARQGQAAACRWGRRGGAFSGKNYL
jgi:hypothetical protein